MISLKAQDKGTNTGQCSLQPLGGVIKFLAATGFMSTSAIYICTADKDFGTV